MIDVPGQAVLTQDLLVDGVHFRLGATSLRDLGHKALAVNLSDLAAMGAEPVAALVGIAAPAGLLDPGVDELYRGLDDLAAEHGASIVGGDITASSELVLAVTAVGALPAGRRAPTRAGARPGDAVALTGPLGAAAAGLRILEEPDLGGATADPERLLAAYHRPSPRVAEGRALATVGVHAMMDVSDGLAIDAGRIARASGVRVVIELDEVPIAPGVDDIAERIGEDPAILATTAGDDYELLVAAPAELLARAAQTGVPLTLVGRIVAGDPGLEVVRRGRTVALGSPGWVHDV